VPWYCGTYAFVYCILSLSCTHYSLPILDGNDITGPMPTEIGRLHKLKHLVLDNNAMTGTLPTEIGQMENLKSLIMYGNDITGTMPTEIGRLHKLEKLKIGTTHVFSNVFFDVFRGLFYLGSAVNVK